MLRNYRLYIFIALSLLFGTLALEAQALSPKIKQVKVPQDSAVYYLDHASHTKKVYVNEVSFLNYGHKWSDVRTVSREELAKWPDLKLVRLASSSDIYYIKGSSKSLIANQADLVLFSLDKEPIVIVSQIDLDQYLSISYSAIGLVSNSSGPNNSVSLGAGSLDVSFDDINNNLQNVMLAGTAGNLVASVRLKANGSAVNVTTLKIDISGLYSSEAIGDAFLIMDDGSRRDNLVKYNNRQVIAYFSDAPLVVPAGGERVIKVWLDLKSVSGAVNQTIYANFKSASNIESNGYLTTVLPIQSTVFKLLSTPGLIASPRINETSVAAYTGGANFALANFTIYEDSGNEDVYIKQLSFVNDGSLNISDLDTFRLQKDNTIIARTAKVASNHRIVFDIGYLRVDKNHPVAITVYGQKGAGFVSGQTLNLSLDGAWVSGSNFKQSLMPAINNISEFHTIN